MRIVFLLLVMLPLLPLSIQAEDLGESDASGHVWCAGSGSVDAGSAARGLEDRGMGLGNLPGGICVGDAVG